MYKPEINVFHHPTTTVFIDDSPEFLYSIALGVDRLPYRSFGDPAAGLDYVNSFASTYFAQGPTSEPLPGLSASTSRIITQCSGKLDNPSRFAEPSVLVVDYSMPTMSGLELCSRISNPNVKKVLLTGVADEKVAIEALNTETIDFYISKNEPSLSYRLRNIITHLENRYFQDLFGWAKDMGVSRDMPHLFDAAFADYFEDTCERLDIVEHYPMAQPSGFVLVNRYGAIHHLLVCNDACTEQTLRRATQAGMAAAQLEQIRQHQALPYHIAATAKLHPVTVIHGKTTSYCALIENRLLQAEIGGNAQTTASYQDYLQPPSLQIH